MPAIWFEPLFQILVSLFLGSLMNCGEPCSTGLLSNGSWRSSRVSDLSWYDVCSSGREIERWLWISREMLLANGTGTAVQARRMQGLEVCIKDSRWRYDASCSRIGRECRKARTKKFECKILPYQCPCFFFFSSLFVDPCFYAHLIQGIERQLRCTSIFVLQDTIRRRTWWALQDSAAIRFLRQHDFMSSVSKKLAAYRNRGSQEFVFLLISTNL